MMSETTFYYELIVKKPALRFKTTRTNFGRLQKK